MSELKLDVMVQAFERYQRIFPCSAHEDFSESFTIEGNRLYFWFNTEDDSTHVICREI